GVRPDVEHTLPGRAAPRAALLQPARARLRPVPDPDSRPVAVRLVDPPGRRDHGGERPARRPRGAPLARPQGGLTMAAEFDAVVVGGGHNALVTARAPLP